MNEIISGWKLLDGCFVENQTISGKPNQKQLIILLSGVDAVFVPARTLDNIREGSWWDDQDLDLWGPKICLPRTSRRSCWRMFTTASPDLFHISSYLWGQQGISGKSAYSGVLGEYKPAWTTSIGPQEHSPIWGPSRPLQGTCTYVDWWRALKLLIYLFSSIQLQRPTFQNQLVTREFCNRSATHLTSCRIVLKTWTESSQNQFSLGSSLELCRAVFSD